MIRVCYISMFLVCGLPVQAMDDCPQQRLNGLFLDASTKGVSFKDDTDYFVVQDGGGGVGGDGCATVVLRDVLHEQQQAAAGFDLDGDRRFDTLGAAIEAGATVHGFLVETLCDQALCEAYLAHMDEALRKGASFGAVPNNGVYVCSMRPRNPGDAFGLPIIDPRSNIKTVDASGMFPAAIYARRLTLAFELLNQKGIDLKVTLVSGRTALHAAAEANCAPLVWALIQREVYLDPRTTMGITPFHFACVLQNKEVAFLLARFGAQVNLQDVEGSTPRDYYDKASENGGWKKVQEENETFRGLVVNNPTFQRLIREVGPWLAHNGCNQGLCFDGMLEELGAQRSASGVGQ